MKASFIRSILDDLGLRMIASMPVTRDNYVATIKKLEHLQQLTKVPYHDTTEQHRTNNKTICHR